MTLKKIISGGQSGADQGALRAAQYLKIPTGGWMPKGWKTENGPRPQFERLFNMREHELPGYGPRTLQNVMDADFTVVFGHHSSGSDLTIECCLAHDKPYKVNPTARELADLVLEFNIEILNAAGNRESRNPGIYRRVWETFVEAFSNRELFANAA